MAKQFKVIVPFAGIEVGTILQNVNPEHEKELIESGFIEEIKAKRSSEK